MSRTVRDSSLETRAARSRLKRATKPYYRLVEPGLHVGYRKLASGPGTWVVRRYVGSGKYTVRNLTTASGDAVMADDYTAADGDTVLSFGQAQIAARGPAAVPAHPLKVATAIAEYLMAKEADGRDIVDSRTRANAHILPVLGDVECDRLTTDQIRDWHRTLAKTPGRGRPAAATDAETVRRRQASANRVLTILKAALNDRFNAGKITSDISWRKAKPFKGVDASRLRYLQMDEATRLVNAADENFRLLLQGAAADRRAVWPVGATGRGRL